MKISKLLVLSALCLFGIGAQAADLIERTQPTNADVPQTAVAFQAGKTYLLYNTGTQLFYTQGNAWGTRASIGPLEEAIRVHLDEYAPEGETLEEVTYQFFNYSCVRSRTYSWHQSWFDSAAQMYTDLASQANKYWAVVDMGGNTYRLKAAQLNPDIKSDGTQFVGRDETVSQDASNLYADLPNDEIFPLTSFLTEGEGHHIDWQFFDAIVFEVYDAAMALKEQIELAEGEGVDVSAAVAVYNNTSATLDQINAATETLKIARSQNTFGNVVNGQANDVTTLIENPDYDNENNDGWEGTVPAFQSYTDAEHYNKNFDTYQNLGHVPTGVFALGLKAFYRAGSTSESYTAHQTGANLNAKLYATIGSATTEQSIVNIFEGAKTTTIGVGTEVSAGDPALYVPNNMQAAEAYFNAGRYQNTMLIDVTEAGDMTIGLKKTTLISTDWTIWDTWTLTYYGTGDEAFKAYVEDFKAQFNGYEDERVEAASPFYNTVGMNYTTSYLEALKNVSTDATNKAEAEEAVAQVKAAAALLEENIALWAEYLALAKEAAALAGNENIDQDDELVQDVTDWADMDAGDAWDEQELTNDELRELIAKMSADIAEASKRFVQGDRIDMTALLTNPAYTGNANGWTREAASGGNVAWGSNCYEAWNNASFDVYQVVKNAPEGIYEIEVQGFYRYLRGDNAWNAYQAQTESYVKPGGAPVYVYMNTKQTPFQNVFDEPVTESYVNTDQLSVTTEDGETWYFPNCMANSNEAFTAGMYKQSAYGIIRAGQDMRIGVKGVSNQGGDSWVIWDNFKLYNVGKNKTAVLNVLPDEIANAKSMLSENMGKTIYENLVAAINAAEAALTSDDSDVLFDALSNLFDAEENVSASIALFKELNDANESLMDVFGKYEQTASDAAQAAAGALYEEIAAAIAGHQIEDADVADYLIKIKSAKTQLRLPSDYADASDLAPVEVSPVIENYAYDEDNSGWDGTASAYDATAGNVEIFNANFDYYQDIYGLPAGTYQLSVQGFYRAGGYADDYNSYVANPDSLNYAFYYAMVLNEGNSIYSSKSIKRLAAEAMDASLGDGFVEAVDGCGKYVPNTMVAASDAFLTQVDPNDKESPFCYMNEPLTFKVGADGYARVGLKKEENLANNWCIWDNWTLVYFGQNSELVVDGDASQGIENIQLGEPVRTEFFTLDGRKAAGLMKGIVIMKQTMGNGAVIIKKIRK